jgi:2,3-bisphosphoglycerate-independent phosphoglycerate mutase
VDIVQGLVRESDTKIVLLVLDGLGGLPRETGGGTELETARTPNLDDLATRGTCGLHEPVGAGITPGSGPGHLALFGYDPIRYQVGRGVLSALGIGFDLRPGDVAARGNFCTVDASGLVVDRRAGRISTETNRGLCEKLQTISLPHVELFVEPVKEHRFLLILRGEELSSRVEDTDPQRVGVRPRSPHPQAAEAERAATLVAEFVERASEVLAEEHPANMVLLRGFSQRPGWPTVDKAFGIKAAAVASYPMYRGVGELVGMTVLETGQDLEAELVTVERHWAGFDFFFVHVKATDSAGEDGDFDRKVHLIETVDTQIPRLLALAPDVVVVTGDHSTPATWKAHSWHPIPVVLWSRYCRPDKAREFGESACVTGGLGPRFPTHWLLPLSLANAGRLGKFGA